MMTPEQLVGMREAIERSRVVIPPPTAEDCALELARRRAPASSPGVLGPLAGFVLILGVIWLVVWMASW